MILVEAFGYNKETGKKYQKRNIITEDIYEKIKLELFQENFCLKDENDTAINTYIVTRKALKTDIVDKNDSELSLYISGLYA